MPMTRSRMNVTSEHLYHREVGRDMFKEFKDLARKIDELSMGSKARWRRNQPHMNYTQFSRNSTESIVEFLDEFVRDMTIHEYEAEESVSVNKVNHCNREHRQRDREYYHRNDAMSSPRENRNNRNRFHNTSCYRQDNNRDNKYRGRGYFNPSRGYDSNFSGHYPRDNHHFEYRSRYDSERPAYNRIRQTQVAKNTTFKYSRGAKHDSHIDNIQHNENNEVNILDRRNNENNATTICCRKKFRIRF